jgi:hypothetical protein
MDSSICGWRAAGGTRVVRVRNVTAGAAGADAVEGEASHGTQRWER